LGKDEKQPSEEAREKVPPEQRCTSVSAGQENCLIGQICSPMGVILPWYGHSLCFTPITHPLLVLISSQADVGLADDDTLKQEPRKEALAQD